MEQWSHIEHHGNLVWVRADLEGKHREYCLCFTPCAKFHPGEPNNCPIAQAVYQTCVKYHLVTPVWECPEFEPEVLLAKAVRSRRIGDNPDYVE